MAKRLQLFVIVFLSLVILPLGANAGDEPPGIKAMLDAIQRQNLATGGGSRPTYGSITPDGNGGATIIDMKMVLEDKDVKLNVAIGKIIVTGVSQLSNGQYSFKSVVMENSVMSTILPEFGKVSLSLPVVTANNMHLLASVAADGMDYTRVLGSAVYDNAFAPSIVVSAAGQSFEGKDIKASWKGDPLTGFGKWTASMASIVVPVSAIPDAGAQKIVKDDLGLEKFDIGFEGTSEITGKNKNFSINYALRLTGKKIGALDIGLIINDVPIAIAKVLKDVQGGAKPDMGKIMPLVVGIKVANIKLAFSDDNFTAKALALAAKMQGTTVEALAANGGAIIQIGLAQIRAPEFTKSVVAAYNSFVASPGNISIEVAPEKPVAIATLMGMMAAPAAAIKALGVKVLANQ